jgi:hypothetical protein
MIGEELLWYMNLAEALILLSFYLKTYIDISTLFETIKSYML